jgi:hypothetical protein
VKHTVIPQRIKGLSCVGTRCKIDAESKVVDGSLVEPYLDFAGRNIGQGEVESCAVQWQGGIRHVPVDFQVNTTPVMLADIFTIPLLPTTEERMSVVGRFHCAHLRVLLVCWAAAQLMEARL